MMHEMCPEHRTLESWELLSMFDLFDADHDLMIVLLLAVVR